VPTQTKFESLKQEAALLNTRPKAVRLVIVLIAVTAVVSLLYAVQQSLGGPLGLSVTSEVYDIALSPNGSLVAAGAQDGTVRLWDVPRNREAREQEDWTVQEVYARPLHPYTQALLAAVPVPDPYQRRTQPIPKGEIPNPINPPSGCRFHPRCSIARENCSVDEPELRELRSDHLVACHHAEQFL
jgi:oligopeptide/dipeptide ABC transporter ATP-binding protein